MLRPALFLIALCWGPPESDREIWALDTQAPCYGSGAVADIDGDGKPEIVFGTYFNDEHAYAVNAEDGSLCWKHKSDRGPLDASVAIVDLTGDGKPEVLTADSATGSLYCLDGAGKLVWQIKLPSGTDSPPAVGDLDGDGKLEIVVGTMMTRDRSGRVVALEGATGATRWTASVPGHVQSEPCLVDLDGPDGDGGLDVIVTTWRGDKMVRALNGTDGSERWKAPMGGEMYHGVSILSEEPMRIVATSTAGDVRLLDGAGKELWKSQHTGWLFAPAALADLDGEGDPEIVIVIHEVIVLGSDGKERWRTKRLGSNSRGAAIADIDADGDPDICLGFDRLFYALDGPTGAVLWTFDATAGTHAHERIRSAPLIDDFDGDGKLDIFFVCGKGFSDKSRPNNYGRAYALRTNAPVAGGTWTTFRGNLHRTGRAR